MENKPEMPTLIVSVESRKGGVGKTTAALCMARLLRDKGFSVLVLDMDVTGTNAADIANSPFWKNDLNVIQEVNEKGTARGPLNLIKLFDRRFMVGKTIPDFSTESASYDMLRVDLKKVNVLGSQIYNTDEDDESGKGTTCIEQPSILFDDLHTLWLLEFIKQLIFNFVSISGINKFNKQTIILDNSPGYVGIAPAIHEWLTDRGPECSKFLTVSSLDCQDLCACDRAINELHSMYKGKWETSRIFIDLGEKKNSDEGDNSPTIKSVSKNQEAFFMRLASSSKGDLNKDDPLAFFKKANQTSKNRHQATNGNKYCDHPGEYIAVIINRVPRAVKTGRLVYDDEFLPVLSRRSSLLVRLLGSSSVKQDWRERMIPYDEYIENQFLLQSLKRSRGRSHHRIHRVIDALRMAEDDLRTGIHNSIEDPIQAFEMEFDHYDQLRAQLIRVNDIVSRARSAVEDAGLGHLARLIHDEWLPGSIVPDFRTVLLRLFRESELPYFEMIPFEFETGPVNSDAREFVEGLKKHILMEYRHSEMQKLDNEGDHTMTVMAGVLSMLAGLSLTSPLWHSPFEKEIVGLFAGVLAIELMHWDKKNERRSANYGVQRFLAQEYVTESELRKEMERIKPLRYLRHHMMKEGEASFVEFYNVCTSAQARLIDFVADSQFLLQLLLFIVKGEMERGDLFPFVRGIADEVIVKKSLSHKDAPNKMAKALQTAEYFREFDAVLNEVLKGWGVE